MQRTPPVAHNRPPAVPAPETPALKPAPPARPGLDRVGTFWDMLGIRIVFMAVCIAAGFHFRPFSVSPIFGALVGLFFGLAVILFELRLRHASLRRLIGAAVGSVLGLLGAYLTSLILTHTTMPESTRSFFSLAAFLVMAYIGLILGANKGDMLNLQALGGLFGSERSSEAFLQGSRHKRNYRWARGGHRRSAISGWHCDHSTICAARIAIGG